MLRKFFPAFFLLGCGSEIRVEQNPPKPPEVVVPTLPQGTCSQNEPVTITTLQSPHGLTSGNGRLYFTDRADLYNCEGSVQAYTPGDATPEVLVSGICAPNRIEYGEGQLYWLSHSGYVVPNGDVSVLDLESGTVSTLANSLISPDALALDQRFLYVGADVATELQSPGRLLRIDRQTNEIIELATSPGRVADIALDSDYVYWTSSVGFLNGNPNNDSAVFRILKQGGTKETLMDGLAGPYALARAGTRVYVVHSEAGEIIDMSADGTEPLILASNMQYPGDVASDGQDVYVTTWGPPSDLFHIRPNEVHSMAKTIGYADQILLGTECIYWTEQYIDDAFNGVLRAMAR